MSKLKKSLDINQLSLFDVIRQVSERQSAFLGEKDIPGRLNIDASLRELVSEVLKKTSLSRYEVAAAMSTRLGKEITKSQIDTWSAESKENHRLPVAYLNAFEESAGDKSIIRLICEKAGGYFIEGEDALYTELGKIKRQKEDIAKREKLVKDTIEQLQKKK